MTKTFSIKDRAKSFVFAWNGLKILFLTQHNFRIHIVTTVLVLFLGFIPKLSTTEWILILLCVGMVLLCEAFNSAFEFLADLIEPKYNAKVGQIKDIAAAAVLIMASIAVITGIIIFAPKLVSFFLY